MAKKKDNTMMLVLVGAGLVGIYFLTRKTAAAAPAPGSGVLPAQSTANYNEFLQTGEEPINVQPISTNVSSVISDLSNQSTIPSAPLVPLNNFSAPLPSQATIDAMSPAEQQELYNATVV